MREALHLISVEVDTIGSYIFDKDGNYEQGGDFPIVHLEFMNNLLGTGIDVYVDNDFDEVEIRSHRED